ncbi:NUDIX domain-containing protein [Sutcliffiella rhizosphaerae]|uniref:Nudix hydrolase domain-containing protein n=1 Tax=Sutcliffiella rhizosphaerae TaxID=2880967 RepID=A0ABM8YKV5_9BACI|nr:NUDIX domain-containing protein [Sutcliffiella rhizosphaerae]CAG9620374.1 hypothetical protein BACCIP111883_01142 [Sutcliffiella rhizosphaerae]
MVVKRNIRNSAKAIILKDNQILLTKNKDNDGYFYLFPGGGQEHGETIRDTLLRECMEELGEQVEVGDLLHIREYIGKNHEFASSHYDAHQVEFYFVCKLEVEENNSLQPNNPDDYQVGVEWISISELQEYRVYPKEITKFISMYVKNEKASVYLGDVN